MQVEITESQRQIMLLALHELLQRRPGWILPIAELEMKLGGQFDWPPSPCPDIASPEDLARMKSIDLTKLGLSTFFQRLADVEKRYPRDPVFFCGGWAYRVSVEAEGALEEGDTSEGWEEEPVGNSL